MKKSLVIALALVFVLGIAATAFAAANPFVDVPAKHWAYDAVNKLYKAGVVDGVSAGKYDGNKTMTRYEMAQVIARAMSKSDKADAETKAIIDKLQVEFAAELNNLGVRVAKLEANQPSLKFIGKFDTRYSVTDYTDGSTKPSDVFAQYRLRLDAVGTVDANTTFGMRFVTREPSSTKFGNDTWQKFGENTQSTAAGSSYNNIDRVYFTTKAGNFTTTIGRQSMFVDSQSIVTDAGAFSYDGVKAGTKLGDVNLTATWGRFLKGVTYDTNATLAARATDLDVKSVALQGNLGAVNTTVSFFDFNSPSANKSAMKLTVVNAIYNFSPTLSINALYVKNSAEKMVAGLGDTMGAAKITYGAQAFKNSGDQNVTFQYMKKGANAFINNYTSLDATTGNTLAQDVSYKFWNAQYNYAFSKNFITTASYTKVTPTGANANDEARTVSRVIATVLF